MNDQMTSLGEVLRRYSPPPSGWTVEAEEEDQERENRCSRCNGTGWQRLDVPRSHPNFGMARPCPVCTPAVSPRIAALRSLPDGFRDSAGLHDPPPEATPVELAAYHEVIDAIASYCSGQDTRHMLLLAGPNGTGKTRAAAEIMLAEAERGIVGLWVTVPDLMAELRECIGKDTSPDALVWAYRDAPLVVLDDLGAESETRWTDEKLYQLVNHRYLGGKRTVVTTNLRPNELPPAIADRLGDKRRGVQLTLRWRSYRTGKYMDPHRWWRE